MSTTNPTDVLTEWDELQIKHGNFAQRPQTVTNEVLTNLAIDFAEQQDPLEKKSLKQLDALEDEVPENDLNEYRKRRLAELKRKRAAYRFGEVFHIGKSDYINEVTKASEDPGTFAVVLLLYANNVPVCQAMITAWKEVARRHGDVKFCIAVATDVMENYPESKVPTVLCYKQGNCVSQLIGSALWGGFAVTPNCVEWVLFKKAKVLGSCSVEEAPKELQGPPRKGYRRESSKGSSDESSDAENNREKNVQDDNRGYASTTMERMLRLK